MNNLERTYHFINGLTRSEKRYFKKYADLHRPQTDQDYILLFKIISSQKDFDLVNIKAQIDQNKIKYVSIKTQYLYKTLLEALTQYKKNKHVGIQLNDLLQQLFILEGKGLLEEALVYCKKIKRKAYKIDNYTVCFQVVKKELEVLSLLHHGLSNTNILQCYAEKTQLFDIMSHIQAYENLRNQFIIKRQDNQLTSDYLEDLKQHELIVNPPNSSLKSQILYYQILALVHFGEKNFKQMLHCATQSLDLLPIAHFSPSFTFSILRNYFVACQLSGYEQGFLYVSQLLEQMNFKEKPFIAMKLFLQYNIKIQLLRTAALEEELETFYDSIQKFQDHFVSALSWKNKKNWWFDLIDFYFAKQRFDKVSDVVAYFNKATEYKTLLPIEKTVLRLLQAILYFENQEDRLLLREIRGIKRVVATHEIKHPLITNTLHLLQDLNKNTADKHVAFFKKYLVNNQAVSSLLKESIWSLDFLIAWSQCHLK